MQISEKYKKGTRAEGGPEEPRVLHYLPILARQREGGVDSLAVSGGFLTRKAFFFLCAIVVVGLSSVDDDGTLSIYVCVHYCGARNSYR